MFYAGQLDYIAKLNGLVAGTTAFAALLVGVGVSWAGTMEATTGSGAIQLGDRTTIQAIVAGDLLTVNANARFDGTVWKYIETASAFTHQIGGAADAYIWYRAASGTAGATITFSELARLTSGGFGINVSPSYKLHIKGVTTGWLVNPDQSLDGTILAGGRMSTKAGHFNITADIDGTAANRVVMSYFNGTGWRSALEFGNVASGFSDLILNLGGGNVGIGTAPAATCVLHVAAAQPAFLVESNTTGRALMAGKSNALDRFYIGTTDSTGGGIFAGGSAYSLQIGTLNSAAPIQFYVNSVLGATLSTPIANSAALQVRANVATGGAGYSEIYLGSTSGGVGDYRGFVSYNHALETLRFGTASTERMTLNSTELNVPLSQGVWANKFVNTTNATGHVLASTTADMYVNGTVVGYWRLSTLTTMLGIGVAPSAWQSAAGNGVLQFGGRGSLACATSGADVHLSNNAYWNGTNWVKIANSEAFNYYQIPTLGHVWRFASTGTGNITWTTQFQIETGGNVIAGNSAVATMQVQVLGANSGTNGGAFLNVINGASATVIAIGNYSAIHGGAYNSGALIYSAGNLNFTPNGATTITNMIGPNGLFCYNVTGAAVADAVNFYSSDDAAGHTIPSFYCEGTNVVATGQADSVSSVRVKMRVNGTVRTFLCI